MADTESTPLALVIDDEDDVRQLARLALRVDGWRVEVASNGREGFDLVRAHQPDLILIDLMMPSMSGVEFCRKVVEDLRLTDIPVLMVSGVNEKAQILEDFWSLPLRSRNFLKKPFDTGELIRLVQQIVPPDRRQRRAARPLPEPGAPSPRPSESRAQAMPDPTVQRPSPERPARPTASRPVEPASLHAPTPPPWLQMNRPDPTAKAPPAPRRETPEPARAAAPPKPLPEARPMPEAPPARAAEPPAAAAPPPRQPKENYLQGYRILTIDDDEDIRLIMKMRLGQYHEVETAENGMQGLQRMESFLPDFVITDINMPVMNGLETAEAIRRHPRFFEVPIFFVTGESDTNLPRRAFEIGGNLYLRKPIDPDRLLKCLDYFLRETGLSPGRYLNAERQAVEQAAGTKPEMSKLPRVLVVDFNIENHRLLRRLIGDESAPGRLPGGPIEVFWTEDPRSALGNLNRWEPDLILYNPRNPNLDAVAFGQMLKLNHEIETTHVWLIGTRFYDADMRYSQQVFKHEVIALDVAEERLLAQLARAVDEVRGAPRPKKHPWGRLHEEELERLRQIQQSDARRARERDMLRKRYRSVQEFIDRTLN